MNLLAGRETEKAAILGTFIDGGSSTCVLRTSFEDPDCTSMFFDADLKLRSEHYYLEIGRLALRALLDPQHQGIDKYRYQIVDDALWPKVLEIGANVNLGPLVGLSTEDIRVGLLVGDVYVITEWADAMYKVGELVQEIRVFVGQSDVKALLQNNEFKKKRNALQEKLAEMVKASRTRFDEPWGMVCLFWAGGSPNNAYAKVVTERLAVERGAKSA